MRKEYHIHTDPWKEIAKFFYKIYAKEHGIEMEEGKDMTVVFETEAGEVKSGVYDNFTQLNEVIFRTGWRVIKID